MGDVKQIRFSGIGGQGMVLAGTILGYAGVHDGKWVYGSEEYGSQARGGSAESEVIIAEHPIKFPHIITSDVLVVLAQSAYDSWKDSVDEKGSLVIYGDHAVTPKALNSAKQISVPAIHTAIHELHTKQVANIVILGATVALTGVVSKEALSKAINENVKERFRDINLKAFDLGYNLGQELRPM